MQCNLRDTGHNALMLLPELQLANSSS